jgi:hypothetical protein
MSPQDAIAAYVNPTELSRRGYMSPGGGAGGAGSMPAGGRGSIASAATGAMPVGEYDVNWDSASTGWGGGGGAGGGGAGMSDSAAAVMSMGYTSRDRLAPVAEEGAIPEDAPLVAQPKGAAAGRAAERTIAKVGTAGQSKSMLRVWGIKCRGLRPIDTNGLADPYLVLRVGQDVWKSRVINGTLNPEYNSEEDQCLFGADASKGFDALDSLVVEVWDYNVLLRHTLVGACNVFFGDMFPIAPTGAGAGAHGKSAWYTLTHAGKSAGEIMLNLVAIGHRPLPDGALLTIGTADVDAAAAAAAAGKPAAPPPNCLRVIVHGARGLPGRGITGNACNASLRMDVGAFSVRTATKAGTVNPVWGEAWAFPVTDRTVNVDIAVEHNGSTLEGSYHLQGRVLVRLADFDGLRGTWVRDAFPLVNKEYNADKERGKLEL